MSATNNNTDEIDIENIYDEVEIDDMDFEDETFYYPCPCGDKFQIKIVSSIPFPKLTSFINILFVLVTNKRRCDNSHLSKLLSLN